MACDCGQSALAYLKLNFWLVGASVLIFSRKAPSLLRGDSLGPLLRRRRCYDEIGKIESQDDGEHGLCRKTGARSPSGRHGIDVWIWTLRGLCSRGWGRWHRVRGQSTLRAIRHPSRSGYPDPPTDETGQEQTACELARCHRRRRRATGPGCNECEGGGRGPLTAANQVLSPARPPAAGPPARHFPLSPLPKTDCGAMPIADGGITTAPADIPHRSGRPRPDALVVYQIQSRGARCIAHFGAVVCSRCLLLGCRGLHLIGSSCEDTRGNIDSLAGTRSGWFPRQDSQGRPWPPAPNSMEEATRKGDAKWL